MADPLKQWADSKLGKAAPAGPKPSPFGAKAAPVAPVQPPPPAAKKPTVPDVRADQMSWLGALEQQELKGREADPPPSWIDPMVWEQTKIQMGDEWNALPEPRAAAAFLVHQSQQSAKAAAAPAPGAPPPAQAAPGAPPAAPPPHAKPPPFGGPR
jgi:hypothetical protein